MQHRAEQLGGSFTARKANRRGGTVVEWRVPLA
jgi:signal transduction histidine kinase